MSQRVAKPPTDLSGQSLGPFELVRLLGSGAMGSVYLAKDSVLRREVALKVLPKGEAGQDEDRQERFLREARAAARLIHPNVVQIFQIGEDDRYRFIAMEYVEGMTIRQAAKQQGGMLPELLCIEKMRDAADALRLADSFGICHRDIKPANLLLTRAGVLKIADFGLASQVEGGESIGPAAMSRLEGTPYYMSPEQWYGGYISTAADVYCLGCTFYHLITGKTPYPPRDLMGCFRAHTLDPVPDPRAALPSVNEGFADLLMRCMAKLAPERPTAAEIVEELDAMIAEHYGSARSRVSFQTLDPSAGGGEPSQGPRSARGAGATTSAVTRSSAGMRRSGGSMGQTAASNTHMGSSMSGGSTVPESLGSKSYQEFFKLSGYPFSDIRHPSSFWDSPPFSSALRMLASQIVEGEARPAILLGAPGSGRTFLCEMLKSKNPNLFTFTIEPQFSFGARPMVTLCRQHGAPHMSPDAPQEALLEAFLAAALPANVSGAIAVMVVDGLDPEDEETLVELQDILAHAPATRFAMVLVGAEELPERLSTTEAARSLVVGPHPIVLRPMTPREMVQYIEFRIRSVGGAVDALDLDLPSQQLLHARSGGSPKLVNVFCHNALTLAALKQERTLRLSSVRLGLKSKSYLSQDAARALLLGG